MAARHFRNFKTCVLHDLNVSDVSYAECELGIDHRAIVDEAVEAPSSNS